MAYILMIDDNPQNHKNVGRTLHYRSNHEIKFAIDSSDAIEKMATRRPDVILLDLFIPGMNGFDFFELIHNHPATSDIPIVIHTAVPLDELTDLRLQRLRRIHRHVGFLQFPIEASELKKVVTDALKKKNDGTRKWNPPKI